MAQGRRLIDLRIAIEIVSEGQPRITRLLSGMLDSGKLPSSILMTGPEGAGMELMAMWLASRLNCQTPGGCGDAGCPSCEKTATLEHPDLHPVYPVPSGPIENTLPVILESRREDFMARGEFGNKARSIGIGQIRNLIEQTSKQPFEGGKSIIAVFEADLATIEAQNAFLKLLEEPPPSTVIILATTHPDRLLPTIVSRCQQVRFEALPAAAISGFLETFYSVESVEAGRLAGLAGGDLRRGIMLLDDRFLQMRKDSATILRLVLEGKARQLPVEAESTAKEYTREETGDLLDEMIFALRNLMRLREGSLGEEGRALLDTDLGEKAIDAGMRRDIPADMGKISKARRTLRRNVDPELTLTQLLLDLAGKWY